MSDQAASAPSGRQGADGPPEVLAGRPRPARRGYLVPGLIALAVLALIAVVIDVVGLEHPTPRTLAGPDVATLIAQDMQTRTGASQPPQISCPASEPVRAGLRFACHLQSGRGSRTIEVRETSAQGAFTWIEVPASDPPG